MDVEIRRAVAADAAPAAEVWLRSFTAALPSVRRAHTDDEVRWWFREVLVPQQETWVAAAGGAIVGVLVLGEQEIDQLYLSPEHRGLGIGDRFVELAKRAYPRLSLRTFQVNEPARRFYARHGFAEGEFTDGRDNEEHEPDLLMTWSG